MKICLSILVSFLILSISYSQENNNEYCENYCENDIINKQCLKKCMKSLRKIVEIEHSLFDNLKDLKHTIDHKSQITVKLKDVNPFIYKVTLNEIKRNSLSSDVINDDDITSINISSNFEKTDYTIEYFSPDNDINISLDEKIKNKLNEINNIDKEISDLKKNKENLLDKKSKLITLMNLNSLIDKDDKTENKISFLQNNLGFQCGDDLNLKRNKIEDDIKQLDSLIKYKSNEIKEIKDQDAIRNSVYAKYLLEKGKYDNTLEDYLSNVSQLHRKIDFYDELIIILKSDKRVEFLIKEKRDLLTKYFGEASTGTDIIYQSNDIFVDLFSNFNKLKMISDNIKLLKLEERYISQFNKSFQELVNYHNKIDQKKYKNLFIETKKIYNSITEENWTVTYQTSDIPKSSDGIFYTLKLDPIDGKIINKTKTRNYDFEIENGIKVDFNAGIFYHIGLQDETFRLERNSAEPAFANIIKDDSNNGFVPSLGGVFNVYKRSSSNVKLAFNFGGGTNVDKTFFYLGGGLVLGKSERVGISFGAVGGSVNRIEGAYRDLDRIPIALDQELNDITINTENVYRIGLYVGVTYNLSKKNDENLKKSLSNFID